ncbi:5-OH-xanthotoxin synthase-like [Mercurialis annua]|uniref:5-OH-xanthotoxin synthase-like n=1 Tax=Mercurialis annua TaxID=3986 RepID=UPI002160C8DE|nr:5-OH-xanthotoxin synthase-like [Mercurialis annua]
MLLIFFVVLVPIFLAFLLKKRKFTHGHQPPGPTGLPIIGNLLQLNNTNTYKYLWQLSQEYGPLMSLKLGSKPTLVVSSAEMAKQVLKIQDLDFCSRPLLAGQRKLSYNGLDLAFAPYDDYWREMRKICVLHLLSSNRVQSFRPIREEEVSRMIRNVSKLAGESKPVNLTEEMMGFTSTAICRVAYGKRLEGSEAKRLHRLLNESQAMFSDFFFSDYFPHVGWIVDKMSGLMSRLDKNFQEFDVFYQQLIDEHLDPKREMPEELHDNLIDVLLQIWKDQSLKIQLTFDHIKAILMNIFVGGTDTSAATVVWAMSFLMTNPEAMKKTQQQIRKLFGQKGFIDEDDVQQLSYLKAVVKETMRLQPTAPLLIPRETINNCTLGGYQILKKTLVYVNAWAIGRDPQVWEKPLEFYPERFLDSNMDMKGQDYELIPFGAGRRICPGMFIGIANVELSLANLLYKFNWEMPDGMKPEEIDTDHVLPGLSVQRRDHLLLMAKSYIL